MFTVFYHIYGISASRGGKPARHIPSGAPANKETAKENWGMRRMRAKAPDMIGADGIRNLGMTDAMGAMCASKDERSRPDKLSDWSAYQFAFDHATEK